MTKETKENLNEAKQTEESKSLLIFLLGRGGEGGLSLKIVDIDLAREYMLAKLKKPAVILFQEFFIIGRAFWIENKYIIFF